jgi:hypothetical protein
VGGNYATAGVRAPEPYCWCHPASMARSRSAKSTRVGRLRSTIDRPLVWGTIYLALIPAGACLYDFGGLNFYQTSATHEPACSENPYRAKDGIRQAISDAIDYQALQGGRSDRTYSYPSVIDPS